MAVEVNCMESLMICPLSCRYMVGRRWFGLWNEYVKSGDQNSPSFPGKIDNTELFAGESGNPKIRTREGFGGQMFNQKC